MGNFISSAYVSKLFFEGENFRLLNVGYEDFSIDKPSYTFYMQGFYTWHFVISGQGILDIEEKRYHLRGGDMFWIPPNIKMRYFPLADDPWEYVWFAFRGEESAQYGSMAGFSQTHAVQQYPPHVPHVLHRMIAAVEREECGYFGALSAFYETLDVCTSHVPHTEMQKVKALIDANFNMPSFKVERLCTDVGISHAQLLRLFKKTYGTTLVAYIIDKKISLAKELLATTDLPVQSVAFSSGFADAIHFMKTFKKATGLSASRYRQSVPVR